MKDAQTLQIAYETLTQGRADEAIAITKNILTDDPACDEAWHLLGTLYLQQHRTAEGIDCLIRACALSPANPFMHNNLANGYFAQGQWDAALHHYSLAVQINPDFPQALHNRGKVYHQRKEYDQALADFDAGLRQQPDSVGLWVDRGLTLYNMHRWDEARDSFTCAISFDGTCAAAFYGRGMVDVEYLRFDDALSEFDAVLQLDHTHRDARLNHSTCLKELGQLDRALAGYDLLITQNPDDTDAVFHKALILLLRGDFENGLPLYEKRRFLPDQGGARSYPQPLWTRHESLIDKTLFIYCEQGLGDIFQFCRYLSLLPAVGQVIVAAPRGLWHFLRRLRNDLHLIDFKEAPESFDFHIPLLSLPLVLGTKLDTVPATVPYLQADPLRVAMWRERIGSHGFKIGVCWRGANVPTLRGRGFPLTLLVAMLTEIATLPHVRLISLQKGEGLEELKCLPPSMRVEAYSEYQDIGPDGFADTAAMMMQMDLIITLDSAPAHLAGALARPVWIALKYLPDWRWRMEGDDNPWYPTARLFRQDTRGDWQTVFKKMERELRMNPALPTVVPNPLIAMAWGEVFDKITILEIKLAHITSPTALAHIRTELATLRAAADPVVALTPALPPLIEALATINQKLWHIEDALRAKEKAKTFDDAFISLARSVYMTNDQRAATKRKINDLLASTIVEEKSYTDYGGEPELTLKLTL